MNSETKAELPDNTGADVPLVEPVVSAESDEPSMSAVRKPLPRPVILILGALSLAALLGSGLLWQKLSNIQEQLARQSAETGVHALEARATSKQAQELARETAARVAVFEARLGEVALQRSQLEELMQSLSRTRDENLVVDIESTLRLAQQQAQLTGSIEPLLAALRSADKRVTRAAQPRLTPLQRAITRDIDRVKSAAVSDTPGLLIKLDELVHMADGLVLVNDVPSARATAANLRTQVDTAPTWWQRSLQVVLTEARSLVRVSRIAQPEAALLSPEQSFFLRENIKLKLLNARMGLLARQLVAARVDLADVTLLINKYFDATSRKTQSAVLLLQQVQTQMQTLQLPRIDETLAALSTAAAGR